MQKQYLLSNLDKILQGDSNAGIIVYVKFGDGRWRGSECQGSILQFFIDFHCCANKMARHVYFCNSAMKTINMWKHLVSSPPDIAVNICIEQLLLKILF